MILILKKNRDISAEEEERTRKSILKQMKEGLIIIPKEYEIVYVDNEQQREAPPCSANCMEKISPSPPREFL